MKHGNLIRLTLIFVLFGTLFTSSFNQIAVGEEIFQIPELFNDATKYFMIGEYRQSIILYDKILELEPNNVKTLLMKGVALSNIDRHKNSILEFKKVLYIQPENLMALLGVGVGFGNLGEYKTAQKYFDDAYEISPENHIALNYKEFAEKVIKKYPYKEVEGPKIFEVENVETIPYWVKNNAGWWANGEIPDATFVSALQFLIQKNIIKIQTNEIINDKSSIIPDWVKYNAAWWANGKIPDIDFLSGIHYMIKNGIIIIEIQEKNGPTEEEQFVINRNLWEFERYLDRILTAIEDDTRYIEYPNPSGDVIKKFLRDYVKWNFEQQIEMGNSSFPSPTYTQDGNVYHVNYKIYINSQPNSLPLDHVSTLTDSFAYWENETLKASDGKDVKIKFTTTESKADANLWVTWVVRSLGENVLGHANLGKGVIEVALGGYGCDGNFQLYHVETVKKIMTHELGHGIGLLHSKNTNDIMYPSLQGTQYAYCLLDVNKQFTKDVEGIILRK